MTRLRFLLACIIAATTLGIAAPTSALACAPEDNPPCPPCGNSTIDGIYRKVTGKDLFHCPW